MLPLVRLPSLDLIKGFVAVARRMSVTQAADDLCLTQSAISKQIRTLEDILGVPLFHRGFRSLMLTEQGHRLFRAADASVLQLQEALALLGPARRRPVTLTASTGVASLWLLPRLGAFQQAHPMIDLRLVASNAVLDLGSDLDLAIRYGAERQAPLGAIKLFGETLAPVASPSLGLQSIRTRAELERLTLLEFDVNGRPWLHWGEWLAARGLNATQARGVLHFNQYEQMVQAAVAGQGVGLGRLELVLPLIASGQLAVLGDATDRSVSPCHCWLIQADKNPGEDVRRVIEWVLASAAELAQEPQHVQAPAGADPNTVHA